MRLADPDFARYLIHTGDCALVSKDIEAESVDSIVTDPPYGIKFMALGWDSRVPGSEYWKEFLRVAKPGAHLLVFGGTKTFHRMMVAIEDSGWELRDTIMWTYGQGFPKSRDVSKAIDKAKGAGRERIVARGDTVKNCHAQDRWSRENNGRPLTEAAKRWAGWGTGLKPAWEPIILARKPLDGTVENNVTRHGTGALNIDGTRVATDELNGKVYHNANTGWKCTSPPSTVYGNPNGRWPSNLIHDGSDEVLSLFPETKKSESKKLSSVGHIRPSVPGDESGSAARFFYCAKAGNRDRNEGTECGNRHPTVKPTALMRYLCRLVTPPGGIVLDPFCGSGSTGKAAILEGFRFVGIELNPEYSKTARDRIRMAISEEHAP